MEESEAIPIFSRRTSGENKEERSVGLKAAITFLPLLVLLLLCFYFWQQKTVIVVDESGREKFSTFCRTVGDFLEENGLYIGDYDQLMPGREERVVHGQVISIKRAFPITMVVDDNAWKIWTCSLTAKDLLQEQGVELFEHDIISPGPDIILNPHGRQGVQMVQVARGSWKELSPPADSRGKVSGNVLQEASVQASLNLENRGAVSLPAKKGLDPVDTAVAFSEEDAVAKEAPVSTVEEETRRVKNIPAAVEKKTVPVETASTAANEGADFEVVNTISRGGRDWGIKAVLEVMATAYCPGTAEAGCPIDAHGASQCTGFYNDGFTATGIRAVAGDGSKASPHLIAVDPAVIPLKSLVYIEGYGFARAEDTGSAIKGKSIDILFQKHRDALNFGRQRLKVYILPESVE